jgi:tetratricopeptide (TPR) repeat protein
MNYCRKTNLFIIVLSLLVILAPGVIRAQEEEEENATLGGKVVDVEKKPIESAEINLKHVTMGGTSSAKSNKKGEFSFRRLFPGKYEMTVQKEGYVTYSGQVELKANTAPKVEITLAKGMTEEQKKTAEAVAAFKRGTELFQQKKTDEALAEFQKAIDLKPDFVEAYINKGILHFQNMQDVEAENNIKKALELKPEDPKAKEILANIYFEQSKTLLQNDKIDEALEKLKVAGSYRPEYSYINYLLGYAYNKKGMKEETIKYFELFLQQEPTAPQAAQVKTLLEQLKKQ